METPPPNRWSQVQHVLDAALDHPPDQRAAYLDRACAGDAALREEVEAAIRGCEQAADFLEEPAAEFAAPLLSSLLSAETPLVEGARVGPYRLIDRLGRGGMGTVYRAERDDDQFRMRVALKLVQRGLDPDLVRRFVEERQILASLDHPNIARLLDGGVMPDGLPYLVIEYVDGMPIDRWCDARRLSIDARLELFGQVCRAVQYAHRNLVVHRDLKPSNILVTEAGQVKLLDFGIAKLLAPEPAAAAESTRTGIRPMTPDYASPEQIRGEPVTTASDVYSLGVLLYRLLTGRLPHRHAGRTPGQVERAILEDEPERPSAVLSRTHPGSDPGTTSEGIGLPRGTTPVRLRRRLEGDLDNIVLMALGKEPERRYGTADQLAADVRRHLDGHPVSARRQTRAYRVRKFVRRHRVGVVAAVIAALSVLGGAAGTAWQARLAARQRDVAVREAEKARQVTTFLVELFEASDPGVARGEAVTARALLDRGAARLEAGPALAGQPEVRAALLDVLGRIYRNLGDYDQAQPLARQALALRRERVGPEHPDVAESLDNLGIIAFYQGRLEAAEPLFREALAIRRRALGPTHHDVAATLNNLAGVHLYRGDLDAAEPLFREAIAIHGATGRPEDLAVNLDGLAATSIRRGDLATADSLYREALRIRRESHGADHPDAARSLNNVAGVLYRQGRFAEAERFYREALAVWREVLGDEHPDVATALNNLAAVVEKQGDLDAAERFYREALASKRAIFGAAHVSTARTLNNLGLLLQSRGGFEAAEPLLRESLAMRRESLGDEHPSVATALHNLAALHDERGDCRAAEPLFREALAIRQARLPEADQRTEKTRRALAACIATLGRAPVPP